MHKSKFCLKCPFLYPKGVKNRKKYYRIKYGRTGWLLSPLFPSPIIGEKPWINPALGRHQHRPEHPLYVPCAVASWHWNQLSLRERQDWWTGRGDAWVRKTFHSLKTDDHHSPARDAFPQPNWSIIKWGCWKQVVSFLHLQLHLPIPTALLLCRAMRGCKATSWTNLKDQQLCTSLLNNDSF